MGCSHYMWTRGNYLWLTAFNFSLLVFLCYQPLNYIHQDVGGVSVESKTKLKLTNETEFKLQEDAIYRQQVFMANYRPIRNPVGINCTKIINNDQREILKSKQIMRKPLYVKSYLTADFYLNLTRNCNLFRNSRGYIEHPLSKTEYEFPVAFSILAYRDIEQVERLLRLIYRPHNFYCIHIDLKMNKTERQAFRKLANCLNNVFIAVESIDVKWGDMSLLEAELVCMKTLWPFKQWKYYINLAGQEFPLKTNREIIAILKVLEGANVVDGSLERAKTIYNERWSSAKTPPPHHIKLVKGSMHIAANRHFVDFCLHDPRSLEFKEWLKQTELPDETYFSSLNHNPHLGITGSFLGQHPKMFHKSKYKKHPAWMCAIESESENIYSTQTGGEAEEYYLKPFFLRFVIWQFPGLRRCLGKFVREVCVLGVGDLYRAYNGIELFANKFHLDFEHLALDCLEELLYEKTWKEYLEDIPIDTSYYRHLHYAKMQLKP